MIHTVKAFAHPHHARATSGHHMTYLISALAIAMALSVTIVTVIVYIIARCQ